MYLVPTREFLHPTRLIHWLAWACGIALLPIPIIAAFFAKLHDDRPLPHVTIVFPQPGDLDLDFVGGAPGCTRPAWARPSPSPRAALRQQAAPFRFYRG